MNAPVDLSVINENVTKTSHQPMKKCHPSSKAIARSQKLVAYFSTVTLDLSTSLYYMGVRSSVKFRGLERKPRDVEKI